MKPRAVFVTVCIGVAGILVFGAWNYIHAPISAPKPQSQFQERVNAWNDRFESRGVENAYAEYLEEGERIGYMKAHELAHIIGELLYDRYGGDGVTVCTDDFAFGCYHGFAGKQMAEKGLDSVTDMQDACSKTANPIGCEHGIGHAILAFLGDGELIRALDLCPDDGGWLGGCTGGVFMEFNYHTMQSVDGLDPRVYDEHDPYAPCDSVPRAYMNACYYELPAWWRITLEDSVRDVPSKEYPVLGNRCSSVREPYRDSCYRGIGNMVGPVSEYSAALMREWCDMLPQSGRALCYQEALGHLLQSEKGKEELRALCAQGAVEAGNLCGRAAP